MELLAASVIREGRNWKRKINLPSLAVHEGFAEHVVEYDFGSYRPGLIRKLVPMTCEASTKGTNRTSLSDTKTELEKCWHLEWFEREKPT